MTTPAIGRGIFGWHGSERRSDRYGAFALWKQNYDGDAKFTNPGYDRPMASMIGKRCKIEALVLEARKSGHIGDIFHGFRPVQPQVGDLIDLGTGELFVVQWNYAEGVGLKPDDGRSDFWFDPVKLYRLHDQTVEITITPLAS